MEAAQHHGIDDREHRRRRRDRYRQVRIAPTHQSFGTSRICGHLFPNHWSRVHAPYTHRCRVWCVCITIVADRQQSNNRGDRTVKQHQPYKDLVFGHLGAVSVATVNLPFSLWTILPARLQWPNVGLSNANVSSLRDHLAVERLSPKLAVQMVSSVAVPVRGSSEWRRGQHQSSGRRGGSPCRIACET
jgi:hypothetical protein